MIDTFRHRNDRVEVDMFWEFALTRAEARPESKNNLLITQEG